MRGCLLALLAIFCGQSSAVEVLRIGFPQNLPPYVFADEPRGLEYEIVASAANRVGLELSPYYAPMDRLHLLLKRGELDAIASSKEGSGVQAFYADSHVEFNTVVIALADRKLQINSIADLAGYSISSFQRARFFLGPEFRTMAAHNRRYREEPREINRNRLLYSGRIDLVVADLRIFRYFNTQVADQVDVKQPISIYPLFPAVFEQVGFRQARQRDRFNQGLKAIRASGEYLQIEQKYANY